MDTKFQINQLRQDKIIYAIEAVAVNVTCLIAYLLIGLLSNILPNLGFYLFYASVIILAIGMLYTFYALFGNLSRLKRIRRLETDL